MARQTAWRGDVPCSGTLFVYYGENGTKYEASHSNWGNLGEGDDLDGVIQTAWERTQAKARAVLMSGKTISDDREAGLRRIVDAPSYKTYFNIQTPTEISKGEQQ